MNTAPASTDSTVILFPARVGNRRIEDYPQKQVVFCLDITTEPLAWLTFTRYTISLIPEGSTGNLTVTPESCKGQDIPLAIKEYPWLLTLSELCWFKKLLGELPQATGDSFQTALIKTSADLGQPETLRLQSIYAVIWLDIAGHMFRSQGQATSSPPRPVFPVQQFLFAIANTPI